MRVVGKKGVSDVVSTVLIILLVVAAVAIIGTIVLRTVTNTGAQVGTAVNCQELQILPTKCTYASGSPTLPTVLVNRKAGGTNLVVSGLTLIFTKNGETETSVATAPFPQVLETKAYTLSTALTAPFSSPDSVQVAATITADGKSSTCPFSQKVSCTSTTTGGGISNTAKFTLNITRADGDAGNINVSSSNPSVFSCTMDAQVPGATADDTKVCIYNLAKGTLDFSMAGVGGARLLMTNNNPGDSLSGACINDIDNGRYEVSRACHYNLQSDTSFSFRIDS